MRQRESENRLEKLLACLFAHGALSTEPLALFKSGPIQIDEEPVFGIPSEFTGKPIISAPQPPRPTIPVKAISLERDDLEIRFPRVEGYRVELPSERLEAVFDDNFTLVITPELIGAPETLNSGIIGELVNMNLIHAGDVRNSQFLCELTSHLVMHKWRDPRRGTATQSLRPAQALSQAMARPSP